MKFNNNHQLYPSTKTPIGYFLCMLFLIFGSHFNSSLGLNSDGKCKVLALRGGGTRGAYEAGALKAIIKLLKP